MFKYIKFIITAILLILILGILALVIIRNVNEKNMTITSEEGIETSFYLQVNGIDQYIQVRGEDKSNPLVIFIHGGPGFPLSYLSKYYQKDLVDDFTVLSYDQRQSGRTYYKNESEDLSLDLMLSDLDIIVDYALETYDQEKVILIGQSWGSVLGTLYTEKYPEKVKAYVGVGQVTDFDEGKVYAAQQAMLLANRQDQDVLIKTSQTFKQVQDINNLNVSNLEEMILTSLKYLTGKKELAGLGLMWQGVISPDMTLNDFKWFMNAMDTRKIIELESPLIDYMYYGYNSSQHLDYEVPIFFIQGSHDYITPTEMVRNFYLAIDAPIKDFKLINETGHTPFLDDRETFADIFKSLIDRTK